MPDGLPDEPVTPIEDVVLTEEGAMVREQFEAREQAETAAPEVPEVELLERARKEIVSETSDSPITTALESAAGAALFGLPGFLSSSEKREEMRRRREASPTSASVGEFAGSVIPAALSGGAGAAGAFARLTPTGKAAAMAGRFAAGGSTKAAQFARTVGAGVFEGAVEGLGNELARQSLSESPDFSAEALLASAGKGAALGGGLNAILSGIGIGVQKLGARRKAAADASVAERLAAADAAAQAARKKDVSIADVVSHKGRQETPEAFAAMVGRVDDAKRAVKGDAVDKLLAESGVALSTAERDTLQTLLRDLDEASTTAKTWAGDYADALGVDDLTRATREDLAKAVADDLDDRGAIALADLDEKFDAYELAIAEARDRHGVATKADQKILRRNRVDVPAVETAPAAEAATGERDRLGQLAGAVGVAELAQDMGHDLGLPSVKDIPVFGRSLSAFAKFKAGARALGSRGVRVPRTEATGAAARVNSVRNRLSTAAARVAEGGRAVLKAPATTRAAKKATRQLLGEIMSSDPTQVQERVAEATRGAPSPVRQAAAAAMGQTLNYLQQTAPQNPLQGTPWGERWKPAPIDAVEWQRRYDAAQNPEAAILRVLQNPNALVEAETVRVTAPALWRETRAALITRLDRLAENLPQNRALAIGRAFDLPLHQSQAPGYGRFDVTRQQSSKAQAPMPGDRPLRGPSANASPIATGDVVEP